MQLSQELSKYPLYTNLSPAILSRPWLQKGHCPNAEKYYNETISIPLYPNFPPSDQKILQVFRGYSVKLIRVMQKMNSAYLVYIIYS